MTEGSSVVEAVALSGGVRDSPRASWPGATDLQDEASGGPGNGPGRDDEVPPGRSRLAGHRTTDRRSGRGLCIGGGHVGMMSVVGQAGRTLSFLECLLSMLWLQERHAVGGIPRGRVPVTSASTAPYRPWPRRDISSSTIQTR